MIFSFEVVGGKEFVFVMLYGRLRLSLKLMTFLEATKFMLPVFRP